VATGTVAANDPGAGTSGSCDNGETDGNGEVHVGPNEISLTDPSEVQSTAEGFALVAQGTVQEQEPARDSNSGSEPEGDEDADYLEAHVDTGEAAVQVCIDEDSTSQPEGPSDSPVLVDGSPTGPADNRGEHEDRDCEYNQNGEETGDSDPGQLPA